MHAAHARNKQTQKYHMTERQTFWTSKPNSVKFCKCPSQWWPGGGLNVTEWMNVLQTRLQGGMYKYFVYNTHVTRRKKYSPKISCRQEHLACISILSSILKSLPSKNICQKVHVGKDIENGQKKYPFKIFCWQQLFLSLIHGLQHSLHPPAKKYIPSKINRYQMSILSQ